MRYVFDEGLGDQNTVSTCLPNPHNPFLLVLCEYLPTTTNLLFPVFFSNGFQSLDFFFLRPFVHP